SQVGELVAAAVARRQMREFVGVRVGDAFDVLDDLDDLDNLNRAQMLRITHAAATSSDSPAREKNSLSPRRPSCPAPRQSADATSRDRRAESASCAALAAAERWRRARAPHVRPSAALPTPAPPARPRTDAHQ